jgi:transcriptional/translational regulatory protein YebC/TACO1
MFQRVGTVRAALPAGENADSKAEELLEEALAADAADFDQSEPADGVVEIEVCPSRAWSSVLLRELIFCAPSPLCGVSLLARRNLLRS